VKKKANIEKIGKTEKCILKSKAVSEDFISTLE
jgi:hypothetical protein